MTEPAPTPRYDQIVAAAARIAEEHGHGHVGAEHLQLALLADRHALSTQAIEQIVAAADLATAVENEITRAYRGGGS